MLKGGLALELRLAKARTTRDIDIRLARSRENLLEDLRAIGRLQRGDHFTYEVRPERILDGDGIEYEGHRFRVTPALAGRPFAQPFDLDVVIAGEIMGEPVFVKTHPWLAFAGIDPTEVRVLPLGTHVAEKLHAYTMPRPAPNSRVRDLPDMALLATTGPIPADELRRALDTTFSARGTHVLPTRLPPPPLAWAAPYAGGRERT